jgi:plasmid stability protein
MPLLQVRDFPGDLYDELSCRAREENRSVPQETIVLLRATLNVKEERRVRRENAARRIEAYGTSETKEFSDPALWIREDRER